MASNLPSRGPQLFNLARLLYQRLPAISSSSHPVHQVSEAVIETPGTHRQRHRNSAVSGDQQRSAQSGTAPGIFSRDALPPSLELLRQTRVDVKPERFLDDIDWSKLIGEKSVLEPQQREAAQRLYEDIKQYRQRGFMIGHQMAEKIFKQYVVWRDLIHLGSILTPTSGPTSDPNANCKFDLWLSQHQKLEEMKEAIEKCLRLGQIDRAQKLTDLAIQKSDRLCELLERVSAWLEKAEAREACQLRRSVRIAGGVVLVALGTSYAGSTLQLPTLPAEMIMATADAAMIGSVVCIVTSTAKWLGTPDFEKFKDRVFEIQCSRLRVHDQIHDLLWDAVTRDDQPNLLDRCD